MTTTHDRTYQLDEFPPNRTVNRPEDENNGESTMKTDYSYKRISDPAMVSCLKTYFWIHFLTFLPRNFKNVRNLTRGHKMSEDRF